MIGGRDYITPKRRQGLYLVYKRYILPIAWLYATYHPLQEPEKSIDKKSSTLPKTNSSPLQIGRNPKRKDHLPTTNFAREFAVSFREGYLGVDFILKNQAGWCSTPTLLLICSSFSRENGHSLLICSSLSTAQKEKYQFLWQKFEGGIPPKI